MNTMKNGNTLALLIAGAVLSSGLMACAKIEKGAPAQATLSNSDQIRGYLSGLTDSVTDENGVSSEQRALSDEEVADVVKASEDLKISAGEIQTVVDSALSEICTATEDHVCTGVRDSKHNVAMVALLKLQIEKAKAEIAATAPQQEAPVSTEASTETPATETGK